MEEIFDIIDTQGNPTGETVTREKAHAEGIPHRTAHGVEWNREVK